MPLLPAFLLSSESSISLELPASPRLKVLLYGTRNFPAARRPAPLPTGGPRKKGHVASAPAKYFARGGICDGFTGLRVF